MANREVVTEKNKGSDGKPVMVTFQKGNGTVEGAGKVIKVEKVEKKKAK